MRCEEVMKKDVECLSPQDTVQAAARRMREANVGFLPVSDRSRKVLGVVTDRDLAVRYDGKRRNAGVRRIGRERGGRIPGQVTASLR